MSSPAVRLVTPHAFTRDLPVAKIIGRDVCRFCGLARLHNLLTDWCVAKGCDFRDHPGFPAACRTLPAAHRRATT